MLGRQSGRSRRLKSLTAAIGLLNLSRNHEPGPQLNIDVGKNGGRYRVRTCGPYHVKVVLYR